MSEHSSFIFSHPPDARPTFTQHARTDVDPWRTAATHRPAHRRLPLQSPASHTVDASVQCRRGGTLEGRPGPLHRCMPGASSDRRVGSQILLQSSSTHPPALGSRSPWSSSGSSDATSALAPSHLGRHSQRSA
jgi:hypothetical protein